MKQQRGIGNWLDCEERSSCVLERGEAAKNQEESIRPTLLHVNASVRSICTGFGKGRLEGLLVFFLKPQQFRVCVCMCRTFLSANANTSPGYKVVCGMAVVCWNSLFLPSLVFMTDPEHGHPYFECIGESQLQLCMNCCCFAGDQNQQ